MKHQSFPGSRLVSRNALQAGVLCSLTLLAAPAANECGTTVDEPPCDVSAVLKAKCQTCHGSPLQFGAPMPLITYSDTQATSPSTPTMKVWQVMQQRVNLPLSDPKHMPPSFAAQLTSTELSTLNNWFAAGAPAGTQTCGTGGTGGTGGSTGTGPEYLPCTPTRFFRAHGSGSLTSEYTVQANTSNNYVCFNFTSPFTAGEVATAWAPIIDESRVLHHWILYGSNVPVINGSIQGGCLSPSIGTSAINVTGWAPGATNDILPSDVGLALNYASFQLQIHYNNPGSQAMDSSGVAFCTTTTPRQNTARVATLGSEVFLIPPGANDWPVPSNCSALSTNQTDITIIGAAPHMHLLGTGFRTEHFRGTQNLGDISNIPIGTWSFENQTHPLLPQRRVVKPGDILRTTCYYDNPNSYFVGFGPRTEDEMCYNFMFVYPATTAAVKCLF